MPKTATKSAASAAPKAEKAVKTTKKEVLRIKES